MDTYIQSSSYQLHILATQLPDMIKHILFILMLSSVFACKQDKTALNLNSKQSSKADLIESNQLDKLTNSKSMTIIDVRTPGEIAHGKIENAIEIDYRSDNFNQEIEKLDRNGAYIVYCKSGGRSQRASEQMLKMGFANVKDLKGGYQAWEDFQNKKQQ